MPGANPNPPAGHCALPASNFAFGGGFHSPATGVACAVPDVTGRTVTANAKRVPDTVACPGCTQLVPARQIHGHLDACLHIEGLDGPSASINVRKRKRVQSGDGRRAPTDRTLLITPPKRKPRPRFKVASKMFRFDVVEDIEAFTVSIPDYLRYRSGFPATNGSAIAHPALGHRQVAPTDSMATLIQHQED